MKTKPPRRTVAVACLVLVAVVAASCGPASRSTTGRKGARRNQVLVGGAMELLGWLGDSVSSKIGDNLAGWALGAIGFGNGEEKQLAAIQGDLANIQNELSAITSDIEQLKQELQTDVCSLSTEDVAAAVSLIQANLLTYNAFFPPQPTPTPTPTSTATATPTPTPTFAPQSWSALVGWANQAIPDSQLPVALQTIDNTLNGIAGTAGSIANCGQAMMGAQWTQAFDEKPYYDQMHYYTNYFYDYQVQGLNLLVEAFHVLAAQAAMEAGVTVTDLTQVQDVCITPATANVQTICDNASAWTTTVYNNLVSQFQTAGAGYSDGSNGTIAAQLGSSNVWVLDLGDFQAGGCGLPLSSNPPCGGAVGTNDSFSNNAFAGYSGWAPANYSTWEPLLNTEGNSGKTVATIMSDLGLQNTDNLIIYTGDVVTTTSTNWNEDYIGANCLLDTSMTAVSGQRWPFCDGKGGEPVADLLNKFGCHTTCVVTSDGFNFTNPGYYKGQIDPAGHHMVVEVDTATGWMNQGQYHPTPEYRWPVLNTNNLQCSNGMNHQTSWGAPTMCGSDFQTWLATQLPIPFPPPPTPTPTPTPTASSS